MKNPLTGQRQEIPILLTRQSAAAKAPAAAGDQRDPVLYGGTKPQYWERQ